MEFPLIGRNPADLALDVTRSGFYAWSNGKLPPRAQVDARLKVASRLCTSRGGLPDQQNAGHGEIGGGSDVAPARRLGADAGAPFVFRFNRRSLSSRGMLFYR